MTPNHNRRLAAALLACLSIASPALAQQRELVHVHVSRADLNLANPRDRVILESRIRSAANATCVSLAVGLAKEMDERRCRDEMQRDGATQVAALTGHRDVELASARR